MSGLSASPAWPMVAPAPSRPYADLCMTGGTGWPLGLGWHAFDIDACIPAQCLTGGPIDAPEFIPTGSVRLRAGADCMVACWWRDD